MVDEKAARDAAVLGALRDSALTLLVERAGGSFEFTAAEYDAVLARYGGKASMNLRLEVVREPGRPDRVRAKLERKPAGQGSLPV